GERLLAVQVISESARNVDSLDLPKVKPDGPRQSLGACVNSRFGAQQVGQVGLGDHDIFTGFQRGGRYQNELQHAVALAHAFGLAGRQMPGAVNEPYFVQLGDQVNQPGATDTPRTAVTNCPAMNRSLGTDLHPFDGPVDGLHPMFHTRTFKGGTRRGGTSNGPFTIPYCDLAVGADIDQHLHLFRTAQPHCEYARRHIAPNPSSNTGDCIQQPSGIDVDTDFYGSNGGRGGGGGYVRCFANRGRIQAQ